VLKIKYYFQLLPTKVERCILSTHESINYQSSQEPAWHKTKLLLLSGYNKTILISQPASQQYFSLTKHQPAVLSASPSEQAGNRTEKIPHEDAYYCTHESTNKGKNTLNKLYTIDCGQPTVAFGACTQEERSTGSS
jgi:hypothetical protein